MTASCALCGVPLERVAVPAADDWGWAGPDGLRFGPDSDLPTDPYGRLAELGARCTASKGADLAAGREYSSLKVRLDLGGSHHEHYPAAGTAGPFTEPVPECCGWPARLRPSGWECRRCGCALVLESAA